MQRIENLKRDHDNLRNIMSRVERMASDDDLEYPYLRYSLRVLSLIWDAHEFKEEQLFRNLSRSYKNFPHEKMLLAHRELRGHWLVLQKSILMHDNLEMKIAFDTDGRMLFDKLRKHLLEEEAHLSTILLVGAQKTELSY